MDLSGVLALSLVSQARRSLAILARRLQKVGARIQHDGDCGVDETLAAVPRVGRRQRVWLCAWPGKRFSRELETKGLCASYHGPIVGSSSRWSSQAPPEAPHHPAGPWRWPLEPPPQARYDGSALNERTTGRSSHDSTRAAVCRYRFSAPYRGLRTRVKSPWHLV